MIGQIRVLLLPGFALCTAASLTLFGQLGALDDANTDNEEQREQQLKKINRSAAQYSLSPADD